MRIYQISHIGRLLTSQFFSEVRMELFSNNLFVIALLIDIFLKLYHRRIHKWTVHGRLVSKCQNYNGRQHRKKLK